MKGLLVEKEERVVVMNAMKDANTGSCNMLRVVEEVASWPSIEAFEEEYRREQVLGSGRYDDDNQSCNIKYLDHQYHIIGTVDGTG